METVLWIAFGIIAYTCFALLAAKCFALNDRLAAGQRRHERSRRY